jgi:hypothetical protein
METDGHEFPAENDDCQKGRENGKDEENQAFAVFLHLCRFHLMFHFRRRRGVVFFHAGGSVSGALFLQLKKQLRGHKIKRKKKAAYP